MQETNRRQGFNSWVRRSRQCQQQIPLRVKASPQGDPHSVQKVAPSVLWLEKERLNLVPIFQSLPLLLLLLLLSRFSRVRLCATPETAAHQAPLSLGFSRQEHWSGLPFSSPMHESEK